MKPWKSPKYLKWIRTLPCIICGGEAEPHHLKHVGSMSGIGTKASDILCVPLCRPHHDEMHSTPSLWHEQWEMICRTINLAVNEGVIMCERKK